MNTKLLIVLPLVAIIFSITFVTDAAADYFEFLDSIPSMHGVYYCTMASLGGYLAMGEGQDPGTGIDIIDVTNPSEMVLAGNIYTGHMTYYLDWTGTFIYSPGSFSGFYIYDVSDIQNPTLASHIMLGDDPTAGVAVRGSIALVGSDWNGSDGGLFCVSVENPYSPAVIWECDTIGCEDIILGQTLAYSFTWCNEVKILDISNLDSPRQIVHFSCPEVDAIDVDESRHLLYATCFDAGLLIYDISNPAAPLLLSTTRLPNNTICIDVCHSKIHHQMLFISGYITGLWAVDTTDPANPRPTSNFITPGGQTNCVKSRGDLVFLTAPNFLLSLQFHQEDAVDDGGSGLPNYVSLPQNYPNPFNNSTVISYVLPQSRNIKLEIYDALGRKVNTLFDGYKMAGKNTISWDASNYPSGTYFYRLTAPDFIVARKMTLLK